MTTLIGKACVIHIAGPKAEHVCVWMLTRVAQIVTRTHRDL